MAEQGAITVVELLDEDVLEEHVINEITEELFSVVVDGVRIRLVLSFARVKHLSSSALGALIRLNKRVAEVDGQLKLCDINPSLHEVFVITKLNKLFDICDTKEIAGSSFSS